MIPSHSARNPLDGKKSLGQSRNGSSSFSSANNFGDNPSDNNSSTQDLLEISSNQETKSESEDQSVFHSPPALARNPTTSQPQKPTRICLRLNQIPKRQGLGQEPPPLEGNWPCCASTNVGIWPRAASPPPVEDSNLGLEKVAAGAEAWAPPTDKQSTSKITTRKRGRPRKLPEKPPAKEFRPAPLTDADWDRIEACGAANFDAIWKACEEEELKMKKADGQKAAGATKLVMCYPNFG
ncbi:hypothetical protein PCANC_08881 [Puccinia coronata f. sp. avenae]|uniref:Uncharacterized protein n=1 Tax=Puccinia coronata f. sp. avenae TaxID=200324 RepID=A0A2N5VS80_9BASI|nr:hypothetical protein PCANC_08881 [Puccinia coronata f. sp. avenae]